MLPRCSLRPVEFSEGTRPVNDMNERAWGNRRQTMDVVAEQRAVAVGREIRFDCSEAVVAQLDRRTVMRERRRERPVVEMQAREPSLMLERPVRSDAPYDRVT